MPARESPGAHLLLKSPLIQPARPGGLVVLPNSPGSLLPPIRCSWLSFRARHFSSEFPPQQQRARGAEIFTALACRGHLMYTHATPEQQQQQPGALARLLPDCRLGSFASIPDFAACTPLTRPILTPVALRRRCGDAAGISICRSEHVDHFSDLYWTLILFGNRFGFL